MKITVRLGPAEKTLERGRRCMRVLVADDEYYARQAILKIMQELEVEVAAGVETGQEIIDFLRRDSEIDAVFTDIRMPEMDGLQAAQCLSREFPEVAVVIVTGYADFGYAQKAIQYGVKDYITKPIQRDAIRKALDRILTARSRNENIIRNRMREDIFEFSKEQLSIEEFSASADLRQRFMGKALEYAETMAYSILLLQTDPEASEEQHAKIKNEFLKAEAAGHAAFFYFQSNREYILLAFSENGEEGPAALTDFAKRILAWLPQAGGLHGSAGIGNLHRGLNDELFSAYKEAVYAINHRLLCGWDRAYVYETEKNKAAFDFSANETILEEGLERADFAVIRKMVDVILDSSELLEHGSGYDLYTEVIRILGIFSRFYNHVSSCNYDDRTKLLFSRRNDLYSFKSMQDLKTYLLSIAWDLCCISTEDSNGEDIIQEILNYVEHNYRYDITLQELAEKKFFMNASYLSRLFKARYGMPFSKYLITYRLGKSKELLEMTVLKVSDIAAHVGYNDVSHYIQSFRKYYGITPEQYRHALSGSKDGKVFDGEPEDWETSGSA